MYLILYIVVSLISIGLGIRIYSLKRDLSACFFLMFTMCLSTWFILYFLFFVEYISSPDILLYLSRINFIIGIITVYSLLFFVLYFDQHRPDTRYLKIGVLPLTVVLASLYIATPHIIETIRWDPMAGVYREVYGSLYWLTIVLYIGFLVAFVIVSIMRLGVTTNLERVRLRKILFGAYFMLFMLISLQVFLPLYDIWILEKELIFFYLYFVVLTYFTLQRYYFGPAGYGLSRLIVFGLSSMLSILAYIASVIITTDDAHIGRFWFFDDPMRFVSICVSLIVFYLSSRVLSLWLSSDGQDHMLQDRISELQSQIVEILDYDTMIDRVTQGMVRIFAIKKSEIHIFTPENTHKYSALIEYFEHGWTDNIYIHDIVFQEARRGQFDIDRVIGTLSKGVFLIFPLFRGEHCIGMLTLSTKSLGDFFSRGEISLLTHFSEFLSGHIRYIETYRELQEISLHLDKRVDEKTIEYNNLINRQKEFIAIISHEIKSPISAAIFQSDSIIDDIESNSISGDELRSELHILHAQLLRTGGLISKLFSVQYYDTHEVELFREKLEFPVFLQYEIDLFAHLHSDIIVDSDIDPDIGFVDIDKVQFQQVLGNLLDNASKFLESDNPVIAIRAYRTGDQLHISLEDSGSGFDGIDIESIFDKYRTGSRGMIGLGMGLYLCKKIISMHGGTILAKKSQKYGGACFDISLPVA